MKLEIAMELFKKNGIEFENLAMEEIRAPKNISNINPKVASKRLNEMIKLKNEMKEYADDLHVYISGSNSKMGDIASVSKIPVYGCKNCTYCKSLCYDLRNDCWRPTVQVTRANNQAIFETNRDKYFDEISSALKTQRFFRWHIGGDVSDIDEFGRIVEVMNTNKHCTALMFTKNFSDVNDYVNNGNTIPDNLKVVFSGWYGQPMDNKYNFCTAHPLFADGRTSAPDGSFLCNHDCTECAITDSRCFKAEKGTSIVFPAH